MRFGHIALRVKDIEPMLDFYCKKLNSHEAFRIKNDDGSLRIIYLHISAGQYLELCLGGNGKPEFDDQKNVGFRHICFTVEDIKTARKEMEKSGVVFSSDILKLRDNNLSMYLFDPEGNKIEIIIGPGLSYTI